MKSKKSTTSPNRIRSIKFPIAPPKIKASEILIRRLFFLSHHKIHTKKQVIIREIPEKKEIPTGKFIPNAIPLLVI
ncbi:MAG: hypothetical protein V1256_00610 [Candidatus Neomarinimicrobiota bacterium]|nr:hypothetical protein [Candidatus Neomarinimicrobiota bacterium]MDP7126867.1 hypothetical protein [Candidatus Neomarinimicrobiota bacterium]MDP7526266.1 hypothetical protein [Candidatus Neomarinimicrobiota bacterium]MEE1505450.1 hypothetical protein [Candidatus Neomarinimicrobiota bacterium]MEE1572549.1 hypothetical protein [Candidatus Neomarinimicrobiota bacterium]